MESQEYEFGTYEGQATVTVGRNWAHASHIELPAVGR